MGKKYQPCENSLKNLKNFGQRPPEERKEIARKGQLAQQESRKQKQAFKELAQAILETKLENGLTVQEAGLKAVADKFMLDGDIQAGIFLRDSSGQKPKEEIQSVVMPIINIKGL